MLLSRANGNLPSRIFTNDDSKLKKKATELTSREALLFDCGADCYLLFGRIGCSF